MIALHLYFTTESEKIHTNLVSTYKFSPYDKNTSKILCKMSLFPAPISGRGLCVFSSGVWAIIPSGGLVKKSAVEKHPPVLFFMTQKLYQKRRTLPNTSLVAFFFFWGTFSQPPFAYADDGPVTGGLCGAAFRDRDHALSSFVTPSRIFSPSASSTSVARRLTGLEAPSSRSR